MLTRAWVATAPTRDLRCGTTAPAAKKRVATAMPNCPLFLSRATIDQVMRYGRCSRDRNQARGAPWGTAAPNVVRVNAFSAISRDTRMALKQQRHFGLRLRLRLRSLATGSIAALGHELVELGSVFGETQALQEFLELALLFFEPAQRVGAIFIECAVAT